MPPPTRMEIDAMLAEFLADQKRYPTRDMLQRIVDNQTSHEKRDDERHAEMKESIAGHHYRITNLESKAVQIEEKVEEVEEDTGQHRLQSLIDFKKKAEQKEEDRQKTASDRRWQVVAIVIATLVGMGATFFAGHSVGAAHQPPGATIGH